MFQPMWEFINAQVEYLNTAQVQYCIILLHRNSITSDFLSNLIIMHIPDNPKWVWKSLTVSEIKYELLRLRQMFS